MNWHSSEGSVKIIKTILTGCNLKFSVKPSFKKAAIHEKGFQDQDFVIIQMSTLYIYIGKSNQSSIQVSLNMFNDTLCTVCNT